MFGLGTTELLIILVIVVLIFGARRLPEIGSGIGKAIKNFKSGVSEEEIDVTPKSPASDEVGDGEGKSES
ncbi:MAG: twin-arginine translocase TatA/TatE family subunit [Myxococcota bacterium]|jgi:sec-independent protein translocase protein TatA